MGVDINLYLIHDIGVLISSFKMPHNYSRYDLS